MCSGICRDGIKRVGLFAFLLFFLGKRRRGSCATSRGIRMFDR